MTPDPLSPRAQALLDAARDGLGPDDAAIARMRDKVLAGAGGVGVAAGTAKAGMSLASKLTIVSLVAAVVGGGAWWMLRDPSSASGSSSRSGSSAVAASVVEVETPPAAAPATTADPVAAAAVVADPAAVDLGAPSEAPKESGRKPHVPASAPSKSRTPSLADEVALVDDAMAALRRNDPGAALAAADDHVARFGARGQLAEEASAIRVESLCRLGDSRWSNALDAFDSHWPRSAQRPRLTSACKGVP